MSQHRKARGMRTQLLVTQYLRANGWPWAESAGSGRPGADVLGCPDISVEVKARTDLSPLAWVRQAEAAAAGRLPFVAFRPNGMGEHPADFVAFLRLSDLVKVLREAGYGTADTLPSEQLVDDEPPSTTTVPTLDANNPTKETQP